MPQMSETVLAPELEGGQWIQHGPVSLKALRDKAVVLVDFWDYTCVNCIRTLPYVVAWNQAIRGQRPGNCRRACAGVFFRARGIAGGGCGGPLRSGISNRARQ